MANSFRASGQEIHLLALKGHCPDLWCTPKTHGSPKDDLMMWHESAIKDDNLGVASSIKSLPQHTLCDSHGLCRLACDKSFIFLNLCFLLCLNLKSNELHFIPVFITCSIHLWTIQWEGQRSRAPTLLPRCSSGSWPGCCKPSSRAKAQSGA